MAKAKSPIPEGFHTVTAHLTVDNAAKALDWYKRALGAEEISRFPMPDGKIGHAELRIGDSKIMLNDPMMGGKGPQAYGGSPAALWVYVPDCDALFNRAVSAGAQTQMPMGDQFWGDRCGAIKDPSGYTWTIATRKEDLTPEEMQRRGQEFFKQMEKQPQPAHS